MQGSSRHVASLAEGDSLFSSEAGSITQLNSDSLPILDRLSIKRLLLGPGSIRQPHWHANAGELTYCLKGELLVGIFGNGSELTTFTLGPGQMFHAPSGSLHWIENVGPDEAELVIAFSHENPEDFSFSGALGAMSDAVLGNTWDLPASDWARVPRSTIGDEIVVRDGEAEVPVSPDTDSALRFDVEASTPAVDTPVGGARIARSDAWPALDGISMYSLRITDDGMREPHWHPETAEMGYVHHGRARMTVQDPDGSTDTYKLGPGDVYFIPRAYPHHIEDIGSGDIHFLVFFDQAMPGDIGYRASGTAMSRSVLAATLGVPEAEVPRLPDTPVDPLVVRRSNPLD